VRWLAWLIVVVVLMREAPSRAQAAEDAPGLVVFHAPADAPASVLAARDALAARARRAGVAWIDRSPAAAPAPEAPALHRRAVEAYEALRFDEAVSALDAAIAEAERSGAAGLSAAQLSDLFLYRGLTYTQRGDSTRAWDDLVRAAVLDPARVLDPLRFPTRAVEAFARARDRVRAEPRGDLVIAAPAGCDVIVDGASTSDGHVTLAYGDHFVRVTCAGQRPWGARIGVAAPSTSFTPSLVADAAPAADDLRALARTRGARELIVVTASLSPGAPPTLSMVRLDVASGKVAARASVALAPGGAATPDAEAAFERVLAPPIAVPAPAPGERSRWWKSPWLWAGVGAAVATAIVLPIALSQSDGASSGDVTVQPSGWTW